MTDALGLYVHVPFCVRKCGYCDFYSVPFDEGLADRYTDALLRAMAAGPFGGRPADTLYLGGGTPSLLGAERIARIVDGAAACFSLRADAEITLEANPGTVDLRQLQALRAAGVNRLSLGVQSLHDGELRALGRMHDAAQAVQALEWAAQAGFQHISADLMLGIPGQDEAGLCESIGSLAALPADHISAYLLKIEPGTPFGEHRPALPDEDAAAGFYLLCVERLEAAGFAQYEVSNFARDGGQSRHNLKYWRCEPYLGIGPAAHSFVDGRRFFLPRDLDAFLAAPSPLDLCVEDGEGGTAEEQVMMRLRLTEGLDADILTGLGADPAPLLARARVLQGHGLCAVDDSSVALTARGFLVSNAVIGELLDALEA